MNKVTFVQDTLWRSDDVCASTKFPDYSAFLPPLLVMALKHYAIAYQGCQVGIFKAKFQKFGLF